LALHNLWYGNAIKNNLNIRLSHNFFIRKVIIEEISHR
jgi:hypothetical protein